MSRQPDRSRSRRIVFAVAVFLAVVVTGGGDGEDCPPSRTTGVLATLSLLPRLLGVVGRGLWLLSVSDKANESGCPPSP